MPNWPECPQLMLLGSNQLRLLTLGRIRCSTGNRGCNLVMAFFWDEKDTPQIGCLTPPDYLTCPRYQKRQSLE
jgi:hypothetical protein